MSAYVIVDIDIHDPGGYEQCNQQAAPLKPPPFSIVHRLIPSPARRRGPVAPPHLPRKLFVTGDATVTADNILRLFRDVKRDGTAPVTA